MFITFDKCKHIATLVGKVIAIYLAVHLCYWAVVQVYVETCAPRTATGYMYSLFTTASPWCTNLLKFQLVILEAFRSWVMSVFVLMGTMITVNMKTPVQVEQ